jgi:microcystin-dependent protein
MATTVNKGLDLQATGSNGGTWGDDLNTNVFQILDNNLGGITTKALTNVNVTLSATESQSAILRLTGTLTGTVTITTACLGFFSVENLTTGNYAVLLRNIGGVGTIAIPPQGVSRLMLVDATNGVRPVGLTPVGTWVDYGGPADSFPPSLLGEYLPLNGAAVSRSTYAALFALYGTTYGAGDGSSTFNVPDTRGRVAVGKDDMSGGGNAARITNAETGIVSTVLGATGGVQSVTLSTGQIPSHGHGVSDPGHAHGYTAPGSTTTVNQTSNDRAVYWTANGATTASAYTGISINNAGGGGSHVNVQPMIIINKMVRV